MLRHWKEIGPPVYIAAAAYLGLGEAFSSDGKKTDAKPNKPSNVGDDPALLFEQFRHTGGMIQ